MERRADTCDHRIGASWSESIQSPDSQTGVATILHEDAIGFLKNIEYISDQSFFGLKPASVDNNQPPVNKIAAFGQKCQQFPKNNAMMALNRVEVLTEK